MASSENRMRAEMLAALDAEVGRRRVRGDAEADVFVARMHEARGILRVEEERARQKSVRTFLHVRSWRF